MLNIGIIKLTILVATLIVVFNVTKLSKFILSSNTTVTYQNRVHSNNIVDLQRLSRRQSIAYLTTSFSGILCHTQLGNKMYEIISTYGIARALNRRLYLAHNNSCAIETLAKLSKMFPNLAHIFDIKLLVDGIALHKVQFGTECCKYDNMSKLANLSRWQYVELSGGHYQSYRYFDAYRAEVLDLFAFHNDQLKAADELATRVFVNESTSSFRLCVHIRRTDFMSYHMQHTTETFLHASLSFVLERLKHRKSLSVLFFGDDPGWTRLQIANTSALFKRYSARAHLIASNAPIVDLAFGARHCQSTLITAPTSTFGFWIAYLSRSAPVFCNYDLIKSGAEFWMTQHRQTDMFLPDWTTIRYNNVTHAIDVVDMNYQT